MIQKGLTAQDRAAAEELRTKTARRCASIGTLPKKAGDVRRTGPVPRLRLLWSPDLAQRKSARRVDQVFIRPGSFAVPPLEAAVGYSQCTGLVPNQTFRSASGREWASRPTASCWSDCRFGSPRLLARGAAGRQDGDQPNAQGGSVRRGPLTSEASVAWRGSGSPTVAEARARFQRSRKAPGQSQCRTDNDIVVAELITDRGPIRPPSYCKRLSEARTPAARQTRGSKARADRR